MAKTNKNHVMDNDFFRVIIIVFGSVISMAVLTLSILAITEISKGNLATSSYYLLGVFVVLGLSRLITYIKERNKMSLLRFSVLFIFDVVLGVIIAFGKDNPYLFSVCGGAYCLSIILSRLFIMVQRKDKRTTIFSLIVIIIAALLGIGLFIPYPGGKVGDVVLLVCLIVAVSAFVEVFSNASSQLKFKVLFQIILKTYALEIILGLVTMMVGAALIFMLNEPEITTFAEGLWYAFAVVTTIGFGDYKAITWIGRLMTVVIGVYGIFVVAVITSIIVNFYNATVGKHDVENIKKINKEDKD